MYAYSQSIESSLWVVPSAHHQLDVSRRAAERSALLQTVAAQSPRSLLRFRRPRVWARARVAVTETA